MKVPYQISEEKRARKMDERFNKAFQLALNKKYPNAKNGDIVNIEKDLLIIKL